MHVSRQINRNPQTDEQLRLKAHQLLKNEILIDGHNDLPYQIFKRFNNNFDEFDLLIDPSKYDPPLHTDITRLKTGGVGAQFWSVYIPCDYAGPGAARLVIDQIDVVHRLNCTYQDYLELALSATDIERIHASGKIASLIGLEGGHSIENSLGSLRQMFRLGARYMTLTHNNNTDWADSATDDPIHNGLTAFGQEVIREMNHMGMLVDLSHVSEKTMSDVLDISIAPVIFTHSGARSTTNHLRNVPDPVLKRLKQNNGIIMITFVPAFINEDVRLYKEAHDIEEDRLRQVHPASSIDIQDALGDWIAANPVPSASVADVADHIDHVRDIIGIDHIGLGGDFDGILWCPEGLEDVSKYPNLIIELLHRNYTTDDIRQITGTNFLRVMRATESTARQLQSESTSSNVLFDVKS